MVSTVGPLILFQAAWPLLQLSETPKFIVISTIVASIADMNDIQFPATANGASKAAINYIVRKLHFENPSLIGMPMHPGYVNYFLI